MPFPISATDTIVCQSQLEDAVSAVEMWRSFYFIKFTLLVAPCLQVLCVCMCEVKLSASDSVICVRMDVHPNSKSQPGIWCKNMEMN